MNETTKEQGFRLVKAGCPEVSLRMDGHKIVPEPIPLGRLWDLVHNITEPELGPAWEFPTELTSNELIEALVRALEDHYTDRDNGSKD